MCTCPTGKKDLLLILYLYVFICLPDHDLVEVETHRRDIRD